MNSEYSELEQYLKKSGMKRITPEMLNDVIKLSIKTINNLGYDVLLGKKGWTLNLKPYFYRIKNKLFGEVIKIKK